METLCAKALKSAPSSMKCSVPQVASESEWLALNNKYRLGPEGTQRGLTEEKHTSVETDFKRQWRNGRDFNTHGEAG